MAKSGWMSWLTSPAMVGAAILVSALPVAAEGAMSEEVPKAGASGEAVREVSSPPDLNPGDTGNPAPVSDLEGESADSDPMAQVTSVSQLSDVQPTDWAFQALQNLVERYGCIAGYPDGTFRGNRAMTRYEFAAGLNACLERITQLISRVDTSNFATKQDLALICRACRSSNSEIDLTNENDYELKHRTTRNQFQQSKTFSRGICCYFL